MHQQGHDAQPGKERPAIYLINPHFTCRHVDIAAIAPGGALRCAASGNLLPTHIISVLRHLADVISSTDVAYVVDICLHARYIMPTLAHDACVSAVGTWTACLENGRAARRVSVAPACQARMGHSPTASMYQCNGALAKRRAKFAPQFRRLPACLDARSAACAFVQADTCPLCVEIHPYDDFVSPRASLDTIHMTQPYASTGRNNMITVTLTILGSGTLTD